MPQLPNASAQLLSAAVFVRLFFDAATFVKKFYHVCRGCRLQERDSFEGWFFGAR